MKDTTITNLKITKKQSPYSDYFIIYNNDDQNAYFVFKNNIKNKLLWNDLESKETDIKKIWVEYEETEKGYKVINFDILETNNDTDF